jgi:hypothetical protein
MTSRERLKELNTLRVEFERSNTTEDRRKEILEQVQKWADGEIPEATCMNCKKTVIYIPYGYALIEGHIYSSEGMDEYRYISKCCEFCFDKMFEEDDNE